MRSFYQHSIQPLEVLTVEQNPPVSANIGWGFRNQSGLIPSGGVAKLLPIGSTYSIESGPVQISIGFVPPDKNIAYLTSGVKTMKIFHKGLFNVRGKITPTFRYTQNIEIDGLINVEIASLNDAMGQAGSNPNVKKIILKNTKNIQSSLVDTGTSNVGVALFNIAGTPQLSLTDVRIDYPYYDYVLLGSTISPNISAVTFNYQYGMQPAIAGSLLQRRITITNTKIKNLDLSYVKFASNGQYSFNDNLQLTGITLGSQVSSVSRFWVSGCDLGYVNFKPVTGLTSVNSCSIQLQDNNMTAAEVNQILFDLNNLSVGGFTSRVIDIGGTNASPTSGGTYDGIAARNALLLKSFTVTI